jgi:hypothetical protein
VPRRTGGASSSRSSRDASKRGFASSTWPAGARGELARVVLALADDLGDLAVAVVEHVVQEERARCSGDRLSSSTRKASDSESAISACARVVRGVGHERLRQPLAHVALRRTRAERSTSIDSRVATVATYARGDSIRSPRSSARVEPQQRLLDHVLRLRHAAEHPVGDGEGGGAQLL